MTFYSSLTPFYDEIFPTNVKAVNFLKSNFKEGGLLLDVGAGTGNMALTCQKKDLKLQPRNQKKQWLIKFGKRQPIIQ
ncbi:hypothetical protein SAMN05443253_11258 [Bacillus sp. OK048]|nr:hypothetical protein SAMN05443253_11258 [Bacillus sp. OK048]